MNQDQEHSLMSLEDRRYDLDSMEEIIVRVTLMLSSILIKMFPFAVGFRASLNGEVLAWKSTKYYTIVDFANLEYVAIG